MHFEILDSIVQLMKTNENLLVLVVLNASLGLAVSASAQTFTTLHSFKPGSDGFDSYVNLVVSDNTLYGAAVDGGKFNYGTIFKINSDGTAFTNLYNFTAPTGPSPSTNTSGANPHSSVILSGDVLYGATANGGKWGNGGVFRINLDGTGFTNLFNFATSSIPSDASSPNSGGARPYGNLVLSSNTLYGTAYFGGGSGRGTVFAISTDGSFFTNLHNFAATSGTLSTNIDGANPSAGLILSNNTLYGTTRYGGSGGAGTVFAVNKDGSGFTNLHSFISATDGADSTAGLVLMGNTLYGTTRNGGSSGFGTIFKINTDGTGFSNLHSFTGSSGGAIPCAGLVLSGKTLYGTAIYSGSSGSGMVFAISTNGTGFTSVYSFTTTPSPNYTNSDGANPQAGLLLSDNTLYGTTISGGSSARGTIFSLSIPLRLTLVRSGTNAILRWPTYAPGAVLQFSTNIIPPAIWSTNLPSPNIINGQNSVTNPVFGQRFFRLSQ
jgi:uncharacterized repeat protein (TIGR03803 family)